MTRTVSKKRAIKSGPWLATGLDETNTKNRRQESESRADPKKALPTVAEERKEWAGPERSEALVRTANMTS